MKTLTSKRWRKRWELVRTATASFQALGMTLLILHAFGVIS